MFFSLSKTLGALIQPLSIIALAIMLATVLLWMRRVRAAKILVTAVTVVLIVALVLPVGQFLLWQLEQRFPVSILPEEVDGVILLGGAQQPWLTQYHDQPSTNSGAETMATFIALGRKYPNARLVFTGGSGDMRRQDLTETNTVRLYLRQQGFDESRVEFEVKSRNTWENALLSKALIDPKPGERWLLVQSAHGLPRAVGVFRRVGWQVTPVPCDYRSVPRFDISPSLSVLETFATLTLALHEWVGLIVYYATGKLDTLFPAPA